MFKKSVVAFLDILGFESALIKNEQETLSRIYGVLANFASSNTDFQQQTHVQKPGHKTIYSNPAISSFSDHIVISQPVSIDKSDGFHSVEISLTHIQHVIARVCYLALAQGFLIRGGITVDDIHQNKNIVFGKALVDAYKIESRLAVYPRVVLSNQLVLELTEKNKNYMAKGKGVEDVAGPGVIRRDFDGLYYIDWINDWKFKLNDNRKVDWETFGKKLEFLKKEIEKNLVVLKEQPAAYKNWHWMASYYNNSIGNLTHAYGSTPPDPKFFPKIDIESF